MMEINNSVVLITGANGGIASHFIDRLLELKAAKIYVCARSTGKLKDIVAIDPVRIV
jgi:NADP-dependent 3-hydroxy acid dehydrogenase YdfG